jgi:mannose-1-phosphate guanylyltransferase
MLRPIKVVLMAGGKGERFWPRSRPEYPKQFLDMDGTGSLLRRTFDRVKAMVPTADILVATLAQFRDMTLHELPELTESNLILEPQGRDTAASLGLAAVWIEKTAPDAIMIALPADHLVLDETRFRKTLTAAAVAAASDNCLVTIGIRPTRPETGYGYIEVGPAISVCEGLPLHQVLRFVEKPDSARAQQYLDSGDFLWNGGMFAWQVQVLRQEIHSHMPQLHTVLEVLASLPDHASITRALPSYFPTVPKRSIDYGVLEHSRRVLVIPAYFGWDDLGSWATVERVRPKDANGNVVRGEVLTHEATNLIIDGLPGRLIAAVGVHDLIVVDTEDAILVCAKDRAQDVKIVASEASARKSPPPHALPKGVVSEQSWGREIRWATSHLYTARVLEIRAGEKLALRRPASECTLYCQAGQGRVLKRGRWSNFSPGEVLFVPPDAPLDIIAVTSLVLVEVAAPTGEAVETAAVLQRAIGDD